VNGGPPPDLVLADQLPRFRMKGLLRRGLDLAVPNSLLNAVLATAPARALAQRIYFHRRGVRGLDFETYRRRLEPVDMGTPTLLSDRKD